MLPPLSRDHLKTRRGVCHCPCVLAWTRVHGREVDGRIHWANQASEDSERESEQGGRLSACPPVRLPACLRMWLPNNCDTY